MRYLLRKKNRQKKSNNFLPRKSDTIFAAEISPIKLRRENTPENAIFRNKHFTTKNHTKIGWHIDEWKLRKTENEKNFFLQFYDLPEKKWLIYSKANYFIYYKSAEKQKKMSD